MQALLNCRPATPHANREVTGQRGEAEVDLCNCQAGRLACGQGTEFNHPCHGPPRSRRILPAATFPGLVPCQAPGEVDTVSIQ